MQRHETLLPPDPLPLCFRLRRYGRRIFFGRKSFRSKNKLTEGFFCRKLCRLKNFSSKNFFGRKHFWSNFFFGQFFIGMPNAASTIDAEFLKKSKGKFLEMMFVPCPQFLKMMSVPRPRALHPIYAYDHKISWKFFVQIFSEFFRPICFRIVSSELFSDVRFSSFLKTKTRAD